MGKVDQILSGSRIVETICGVDFVLRRMTTQVSIKVLGSKTFGLLMAEPDVGRRSEMAQEAARKKGEKLNRDILEVCMISPRLGETDADADTISYEDLLYAVDENGASLVTRLIDAVAPKPGVDFSQPSPETTGAESPNTSTPSDSDTGSDQVS